MPKKLSELIVGQWQNGQKIGAIEAGSIITYSEDGSFSGIEESFVNGQGGRIQVKGTWELMQLGPDKARITLKYNEGKQWKGTFKFINSNRTHNIEENYDSVRIPD